MAVITLDDLTVPVPAPSAADWNDDGVVILRDFFEPLLLDAYAQEWARANGLSRVTKGSHPFTHPFEHIPQIEAVSPGGWDYCTPYMDHQALRSLLTDATLSRQLERLIGEPAGLHLNLTGWVSTQRDWHQDEYLNPPFVGDSYAAVWIALGDIDPRSGPFQYVPGSHRWPQVTRERIATQLDIEDPKWPTKSEAILSPLFEAEILRRQAEIVTWLPRRGDVLIWHGRLLHRGSKPEVQGAYRPALIAHYSGIKHRPDFPTPIHINGGWIFPIVERHAV